MNTLEQIEAWILESLKSVTSSTYIKVYATDGTPIKIRVSDHSANRLNNDGIKTLSFINKRTQQKRSSYNASCTEWVVDTDINLTDTYQSISQVLDWEDVADNQSIFH